MNSSRISISAKYRLAVSGIPRSRSIDCRVCGELVHVLMAELLGQRSQVGRAGAPDIYEGRSFGGRCRPRLDRVPEGLGADRSCQDCIVGPNPRLPDRPADPRRASTSFNPPARPGDIGLAGQRPGTWQLPSVTERSGPRQAGSSQIGRRLPLPQLRHRSLIAGASASTVYTSHGSLPGPWTHTLSWSA